ALGALQQSGKSIADHGPLSEQQRVRNRGTAIFGLVVLLAALIGAVAYQSLSRKSAAIDGQSSDAGMALSLSEKGLAEKGPRATSTAVDAAEPLQPVVPVRPTVIASIPSPQKDEPSVESPASSASALASGEIASASSADVASTV